MSLFCLRSTRSIFSFMLIASFPVRLDAVCGLSKFQRARVNEWDLLLVEIKRGICTVHFGTYSRRFDRFNSVIWDIVIKPMLVPTSSRLNFHRFFILILCCCLTIAIVNARKV